MPSRPPPITSWTTGSTHRSFPTGPFSFQVVFQNNYNLESGRDGAVLEISSPNINGGAFTDITDPAVGGSVNPGYNTVISSAFQSPIAGRMAWTGNSGGYLQTFVNLGNAASPPLIAKCGFALSQTTAEPPRAGGSIRFLSRVSSALRQLPFSFAYLPTPTATPIASPCGSPNVIADSTFEAGTPWSNWTVQTSTNFGTPLCNRAVCGTEAVRPTPETIGPGSAVLTCRKPPPSGKASRSWRAARPRSAS